MFTSHAWTNNFLELTDALKDHCDKDAIVWLDIFSHNQHENKSQSTRPFETAVKEIGHTVMVLSPWNDPIPLKRAWCLY